MLIICIGFIFIQKGDEKKDTPQVDPVESGVLQEFMSLSEVPRDSENTNAISDYLRSWAKENELKVVVDKVNNVIIEKPATPGYEDAPTTILQGNMDMIYSSTEGVSYDPETNPLKVINNGKTLTGDGTNLGADSGSGMATALYILKNAKAHGPLRAIFTVDKETSMLGAEKLDPKHLIGDYLINLNNESDTSLCNSSAGYTAYEMSRPLIWNAPTNNNAFEIALRDLTGGDSGENINENHANAIKILGTILAQAQSQGIVLELASFNGGVADNIIPSDATAVVVLNDYDVKKFKGIYNTAVDDFKRDFGSVEKDATMTLTGAAVQTRVLSRDDCNSIVSYLYGIVNGVNSTSPDDKNFVESSSNIGTAYTFTGNFTSQVLVRSSSEEKNAELLNAHDTLCRMCNINYSISSSSPGWPINTNSTLVPAITSIYKQLYEEDMNIAPIHSSLECGWFAQKNPALEMVSVGPLIENAHTPQEMLYLNTLTKPAKLISKFLSKTKVKPAPPATTKASVNTNSSINTEEAIKNILE